MVAMRDINRGEEITFSCKSEPLSVRPNTKHGLHDDNTRADAPLGMTYEGRQNVLRDWGFDCRCDLCTSSRKDIKRSDERRDRIHAIHKILAQEEGLTSKRIDRLADELLRLVDQESLWPQLAVYYEVLARAYMEEAKDFENAAKYAELCDDTWIEYGGPEHDNVDGVQKLLHDLEMRRLVEEALEQANFRVPQAR